MPAAQNQDAAANSTAVSAYEGGAINLASTRGATTFNNGASALSAKFSGRTVKLFPFIIDLKERAIKCRWYDATHGILNIINANGTADILDNYGSFTLVHLEAVSTALSNGNDTRQKQNALMMYQCLANSLTLEGTAIFSMYLTDPTSAQYGPLLFWRITQASYTTTQAHANNARQQLADLNPKSFGYDITKLNSYVRQLVSTVRSSANNQHISDAELSFALMTAYKRIHAPFDWVIWLSTAHYSEQSTTMKPEALMTRAERTYHELNDGAAWFPSDKKPEEVALAMVPARQKAPFANNNRQSSNNNAPTNRSGPPPFANDPGKKGDTRQHQGKTWHYCPSSHRNGHWQTHRPNQCRQLNWNSAPTSQNNNNNNNNNANATPVSAPRQPRIEINETKLKSLQAILTSADLDDEDQAAATYASIQAYFAN
jgi:hypothetical protein